MNPEFFVRHRSLLSDEQWKIIRNSAFIVAGAGGLGSHVLDLLVRLGVSRLEIWDPGILDEPDLNRQSLYVREDLGKPKAIKAAERLKAIHPDITLIPVVKALGPYDLPGRELGEVDICFDCLDSFPARAGLEAALVNVWNQRNKPGLLVHGGVVGYYGQVAVLNPPSFGYADLLGPDFASMANPPKPVMPHSVSLVGSYQVGELLRYLDNPDKNGNERSMVAVDGLTFNNEIIRIKK